MEYLRRVAHEQFLTEQPDGRYFFPNSASREQHLEAGGAMQTYLQDGEEDTWTVCEQNDLSDVYVAWYVTALNEEGQIYFNERLEDGSALVAK